MNTLVDQTLVVSKLDNLSARSQDTVDVTALIEEVAQDAAASAEHRDVVLRQELEADRKCTGDTRLLYSAMSNLVRNAVKFTK